MYECMLQSSKNNANLFIKQPLRKFKNGAAFIEHHVVIEFALVFMPSNENQFNFRTVSFQFQFKLLRTFYFYYC